MWKKSRDLNIFRMHSMCISQQKTWITGKICTELKARAYKKFRNALWRTIKKTKGQYRTKLESY